MHNFIVDTLTPYLCNAPLSNSSTPTEKREKTPLALIQAENNTLDPR